MIVPRRLRTDEARVLIATLENAKRRTNGQWFCHVGSVAGAGLLAPDQCAGGAEGGTRRVVAATEMALEGQELAVVETHLAKRTGRDTLSTADTLGRGHLDGTGFSIAAERADWAGSHASCVITLQANQGHVVLVRDDDVSGDARGLGLHGRPGMTKGASQLAGATGGALVGGDVEPLLRRLDAFRAPIHDPVPGVHHLPTVAIFFVIAVRLHWSQRSK